MLIRSRARQFGTGQPRARHRVAPLLLAAFLPALVACTESGPRVYTARAYQAEDKCVGDYVALGLVEAEELLATCDPVCLLQLDQLYVSPVCMPYPTTAELVAPEESPECAAALASFVAERLCSELPEAGAGDAGAL